MTELVGILNLTPDSFSDGGLFNQSAKQAYEKALELVKDGADIIDVGAESTRPGATRITAEEEWSRLEPFLSLVKTAEATIPISLDTLNPETVRRAHAIIGKFIVNNVAGLTNPEMVQVVSRLGLTVVMSHVPLSIGDDPLASHSMETKISDPEQVLNELMKRVQTVIEAGIAQENLILDPGIGFGKTPECNYGLLEFAKLVPNYPVMIGYSRKRFLGENRMSLEPNLAAGKIAITNEAAYLRVHDVAGHRLLIEGMGQQNR